MQLRRSLTVILGIVLVLFVGLASHWGSVQRAQAADDLRLLTALGITADDFCGGALGGHDHCPLCRLQDDGFAVGPDMASCHPIPPSAPAWTVSHDDIIHVSGHTLALPRAPPALI